jgi:hypothetical protein
VGAGDPPPGGGSVRESSSRHGAGGLVIVLWRRCGDIFAIEVGSLTEPTRPRC